MPPALSRREPTGKVLPGEGVAIARRSPPERAKRQGSAGGGSCDCPAFSPGGVRKARFCRGTELRLPPALSRREPKGKVLPGGGVAIVFCGFVCVFVVLVALAVAGRAPRGTPLHQILVVLMVLVVLVVFWCFSWFWLLLVGPPWAPPTIRF